MTGRCSKTQTAAKVNRSQLQSLKFLVWSPKRKRDEEPQRLSPPAIVTTGGLTENEQEMPDLTVSFLITNGESGPFVELFVFM